MKPKRILIAINTRWWNAEAHYAYNLALGLQRAGHLVWMVVTQGSPVHQKAWKAKIPVLTDLDLDSSNPLVVWRNYRCLLQHIDQEQIQVLHSFKSAGAIIFTWARNQRPHLGYIKTRGEARKPKDNVFNRWLYGPQGCDGVIAVGQGVKKWLLWLGIGDQPVEVIPYGADPLRPTDPLGVSPTLAQLHLPPEAKIILLLGRNQRIKGHLELLQALEILQDPQLMVLFLIKDLEEFPAELAQIKHAIQEKGLAAQVHLVGFLPDLAEVVAQAHLGVIPSLGSEVNCRVLVEFFSLGLPVVAFPVGSLPDLVEHQKNGWLCTETSPQALAQGMAWCLENPERQKTLSQRAKATYLERFTLDRMVEKTLEFYRDCRRLPENPGK